MKPAYAECELINSGDLALFRRNYIHYNDIKRVRVKMSVNLKTSTLIINETIRQQLQLEIEEIRTFRMEDNSLAQFPVSSPIELHFENRRTLCRAIILPDDSEPVLGAIPFYDMDVIIDSQKGELAVNPSHPDMAWVKL